MPEGGVAAPRVRGRPAGGPEKEKEGGAQSTSGLRGREILAPKSLLSPEGLAPFPFQSSDAEHFFR